MKPPLRALEPPDPCPEQDERLPHVVREAVQIPAVCLIADLVRILRCSRRTVERRLRLGAFPIPELPAIDGKHRWSGEAVEAFWRERVPAARHRRIPMRRVHGWKDAAFRARGQR